METLHIADLKARYRLPASARNARYRLDAVLRRVLDEALEPALERAGIPVNEEICIRRIDAPIRLRLSSPDGSLIEAWSTALADAVRRALADDRAVARYTSRAHALVDLVIAVAGGDYQRAWAWRQLDLWRAGDGADDATAMREAMRALGEEPQAIVAVLREAGRQGALTGLSRRLTAEAWIALARAALAAAGLPPALAGPDGAPPAPAPATTRAAERIASTSALGRAAAPTAATLAGARRALAVLVILDADPAALRADGARRRALVAAVAAIVGGAAARRGEVAAGAEVAPSLDHMPAADATPAGSDRRDPADAEARRSATRGPAADAAADRAAADRVAADRAAAAEGAGTADSATDVAARAERARRDDEPDDIAEDEHGDIARGAGTGTATTPSAASPVEEPPALPPVRQRALTQAGGLLFLLHLVDELGLPDEMVTAEPLARRAGRWMLHQLALELAGVDAGDPAALAFAGLGPEADPPSRGEEPPAEDELAAIREIAARVIRRLHERLEPSDTPPDEQLAWVCRRDAEIVADPGWIELRFSLDHVSTELRRAGLDLDPGYVPWLGVVVRFVYD